MNPSVILYDPYAIIEKHNIDMCAQIAGVRANRDIEYIHRMRVASRRLRTSLWVYKTLIPPAKLTRWKASLKSLARILGKARDLDIHCKFLRILLGQTQDFSHKKGIKQLYAMLSGERSRLQLEVVAGLDAFCRRGIPQDLHSFLCERTPPVPAQEQLRSLVSRRIVKRLEDFLSFIPYVHKPRRVRELHQMRIAAKHLRYSLEIGAPLYKEKISHCIDAAYDIQHILGDVHDYDVWNAMLPRYSAAAADASFIEALGALRARCVRLRERSYAQFLSIWKDLEKKKTWKKLKSRLSRACGQ